MTQILTKYSLLARLFEGRESEVWLVRNTQPGYDEAAFQTAVGFTREASQHPALAPLLDYEAAVAVQLRHPGIESVLDAGKDRDRVWFVSEILAGEPLGKVFRTLQERGYPTLTIPLALAIAGSVCEALHSAHSVRNAAGWSLNASHGGLDLETILLGYDARVRVREFGAAKIRRHASVLGLGERNQNRVALLSPEEVRGRAADTRSDVYCVGAVLYELLTGRQIFSSAHDVNRQICDVDPAPPSTFNAKVTPSLDAIVMRALQKDPKARFQNCEHMGLEIGKLVGNFTKALERMPRVLEQLFPERRTLWTQLQSAMSAGNGDQVALFAQSLLMAETVATEKTVRSKDSFSAQEQTPVMQVWSGEEEVGETLPTGIQTPYHDDDASMTNEVGFNPALVETHMAYKPTPIPEAPSIPEEIATHMAYKPTPMPETADSTQKPTVREVPNPKPAVVAEDTPRLPEIDQFIPAVEEEDEDEVFTQPFDVDLLVAAPELAPTEGELAPVLEVIRTNSGRALDIQVLRSRWSSYKRAESGVRARRSGKKATITFKKPVKGWVRRQRSAKEALEGTEKLVLQPGDAAEFVEGDVTYHVRLFRPQLPPKGNRQLVTEAEIKIYAAAIAVSLLLHGLGGLGALFTSHMGVELTVQKPDPIEVFAEGSLEKPKPKEEKPKPPPKKIEPKPKTRIEPKPSSDPAEAQAKIPKAVRAALDTRLKRNDVPRSEDKAEQLISALTTPVKGDGATIKDVVTNIDAVARPGASNAAFNVTGTLTSLPGGGVNIASSSGGNKIGDIGGSVATNVGTLEKREGAGKVRGKANAVRAMSKVQGTLTQGEVWAEIQKHTGKIQACYERELNKNPSLAGRITFEWIVKSNGGVGTVKEVNSTLGNATVSKCVSNVIKQMKFPKPKGGEVTVVFPWMFSSG